jgi:LacI family transcriptional regulator
MSLRLIAEALGLSVTTVSRALGGFDDVALATRERVLAEAARIAYRPNETARRLRLGRTNVIGLLVPAAPGYFHDPFFMRFLAAVCPRLAERGLDLIVSAAEPGASELRTYRRMVEGRKVDGILLARTRSQDERIAYLLDQNVPFVAHGRSMTARPFAYVDADGETSIRVVTERLIALGHRNIGLINAPIDLMYARNREAVWREVMAAAGLSSKWLAHAVPTEEGGSAAARDLLAAPRPPSAVICTTDRLANGAMQASAGRFAVVAFDNLPLLPSSHTPLITIGHPLDAAIARMVEMLIALIGGADTAGMQVLLPSKIIEHGMAQPIPAPSVMTH